MSRRSLTAGFVAATMLASPAAAIDTPRFVDEAALAGIQHSYDGGWEFFVGGGAAVFDCSGDGFPDLYLAGGSSPAGLYRNTGTLGGPLAFEPVTDSPTAMTGVLGAYPLDIDGDGITDLATLRLGENVVFRGLGNCGFAPANDIWDIDGGQAWTTAFTAIWEAEQTLPTLVFGNYVDRDAPGAPWGTCHDHALIRPDGAEGYGPARRLGPGHCTLSMLFSDWDRDGVPDLRASNDRQYYRGGQEQLWRLQPGVSPRPYGTADGWRQLKIWGMGIASHDLTNDGYPEYFLTSMTDNHLQVLAGTQVGGFGFRGRAELRPAYDDVAFQLDVTLHRPHSGGDAMPSTGWHAQFADVNNDGFTDLFVAKGNVEGMVDFAARDPNNLVLGQADGSFAEAAPEAGLVTYHRARGAAVADLNLDGLPDIVVVNRSAPAELWRNRGTGTGQPMGAWVAVHLDQPGGNADGIGAWIEVRSGAHMWRREVTVGGGHAGGQIGWVHFGVGTAERVEIRAQWPDGTWGPWIRTFANQHVLIRRGEETPLVWYPPPAALP